MVSSLCGCQLGGIARSFEPVMSLHYSLKSGAGELEERCEIEMDGRYYTFVFHFVRLKK